jgi:hypothetical protein
MAQNIGPESSATISIDDSQTSAVHIVAETIFDKNKIHLTEKIFKPMVMMQPFIVFGGAGSLQYMRNYGFETFGDIWDESYDLESDHLRRYQMIKQLILNLGKLSKTRFNKLLTKCQQIVLHNQRHFFSDAFEKILLDELKTNMRISLARQDIKTKLYPGGSCLHLFDKVIDRGAELPGPRIKRLKDILEYLKLNDQGRLNAICQQHPWLLTRGFV